MKTIVSTHKSSLRKCIEVRLTILAIAMIPSIAPLTVFSAVSPDDKPNLCTLELMAISHVGAGSEHPYRNHPKEFLYDVVLNSWPVEGSRVLDFLSHHPLLIDLNLEQLYAGSAGVSEGYSLRAHTLMVYNILREQMHFHRIDQIKTDIDLKKLLLFLIAVHDLGKSMAVAEWTQNHNGKAPEGFRDLKEASKRQHVFTVPLVSQIMKRLEFSEAEQKIVIALIDNDYVGEVAVYNGNPENPKGLAPELGLERLISKAQQSGLRTQDYFKLKILFFIVDAASYPALRYGRNFGQAARPPVFSEDDEGRLHPTSPHYKELLRRQQELFPN